MDTFQTKSIWMAVLFAVGIALLWYPQPANANGGHAGGHGHSGGHGGGGGHAFGHGYGSAGGHQGSGHHGSTSHHVMPGQPGHRAIGQWQSRGGVYPFGHHGAGHDHFDHHHDFDQHDLDHHHFSLYDPFFYDPFFHHHHSLFLDYSYLPYAYYPSGYGYSYIGPMDYGLVDTDVEPEDAEVYLDGTLVGTADDFDGYPDYLYVTPGRHVLEFVLPGYRAYRLRLDAGPGLTIDVTHRLQPVAGGPDSLEATGASRWPRGGNVAAPTPSSEEIELRLNPADAVVYIDGVRQAEGGSAVMAASPGQHTIEVVRPGYRPFRQEVTVQRGRVLQLEIRLEASDLRNH